MHHKVMIFNRTVDKHLKKKMSECINFHVKRAEIDTLPYWWTKRVVIACIPKINLILTGLGYAIPGSWDLNSLYSVFNIDTRIYGQ